MNWGLLAMLFWVFFKVSLFSLGGGYNMIPLMERETTGHGWVDAEEFMEIVALSEATPGPVAVNMATYAGMRAGGVAGAGAATAGVMLPGWILLGLFGGALRRWRGNAGYAAAMRGAGVAVAVLLAWTGLGAMAQAGGGGGWGRMAMICAGTAAWAVAFRRKWIGTGTGLVLAGVLGVLAGGLPG